MRPEFTLAGLDNCVDLYGEQRGCPSQLEFDIWRNAGHISWPLVRILHTSRRHYKLMLSRASHHSPMLSRQLSRKCRDIRTYFPISTDVFLSSSKAHHLQYIILAMYAHPTPAQPYSPAPPILSRVTGETTYPLPSPVIPVRLPVFQLVIWINNWVIRGIDILTGGRRKSSISNRKRWDGDDEHTESGLPLKSPGRLAGGITGSGMRQRTHID